MSASAEPASLKGFSLGVDGGGTKTLAIVIDRHGLERGRAVAGGANYRAIGLEPAVAHICAAAEEAAQRAGARLPVDSAWLGLAGIDGPADRDAFLPHLRSLARDIHLTNDAELLLSALPGCIGVALIAGTGSIAIGRDVAGTSARAGGWGHILGDEGSGYDIGRQALVAAARSADGRGQPTLLLARVLHEWGLSRADDLIDVVYRHNDKARIAGLAPLVLQAAREHDPIAGRIARRAAGELALAALAAGDQLAFRSTPLPLALGGSLLLRDADFRAEVLRNISRRHPLDVVTVVDQPAWSAARVTIARSPS